MVRRESVVDNPQPAKGATSVPVAAPRPERGVPHLATRPATWDRDAVSVDLVAFRALSGTHRDARARHRVDPAQRAGRWPRAPAWRRCWWPPSPRSPPPSWPAPPTSCSWESVAARRAQGRRTAGVGRRASPPARDGARGALRQGHLSNLGNPKIAAFFTGLLPQFTRAGEASFDALLMLGLAFCGLTLL